MIFAWSPTTKKIRDWQCFGSYRRSCRTVWENKQMSAIVLVSGGMDSCVTTAIAAREYSEMAFLHISYGQRTEKRERRAFNDIADFYGIDKRLGVSIEHLAKIGGSSLSDENIVVTEANLTS